MADSHAGAGAGHAADHLARHNERLDAMLEFLSTVEKLGDRLVSGEGAGLKLVKVLLSTMG